MTSTPIDRAGRRRIAVAVLAGSLLFALACEPSSKSQPPPTSQSDSRPQTAPSLGPSIRAAELAARLESGDAPLIVDVRSAAEYQDGHIPGAVHIPHTAMGDRIDELPADRTVEIVVHCQSGKRADIAQAVLLEAGYVNVRDLDGHWANWSAEGLPTE